MIDSSSEPDLLIRESENSSRRAPSAAECELLELFDGLRVALLRYLSSFPLSLDDSEDVVQDAFLSLYQQLECGRSIQRVRAWLFRTVHNLALKKRMRFQRGIASIDSALVPEHFVSDPARNPEEQLVFNRRRKRIQAVIEALPEQNRWCLYLRAEGLRYREIARVLNMSLGAVFNSLQQSLAHIARATEF